MNSTVMIKANVIVEMTDGYIVQIGPSQIKVPFDVVQGEVSEDITDFIIKSAPLVMQSMAIITRNWQALHAEAQRTSAAPEPVTEPVTEPMPESMPVPEDERLSIIEKFGLNKAGPDISAMPFRVNDEAPVDGNNIGIDDAKALDRIFQSADANTKRKIVHRIAGMTRLQMLSIHDVLCSELRRGVVTTISSKFSEQRSGVLPPDLSAFLDDSPISETLGSTKWSASNDLGGRASNNVVGEGMKRAQATMDDLASKFGEEISREMFVNTASAGESAIARSHSLDMKLDPS